METNKQEIWEKYTLLDFMKILSIDSDNPSIKTEYYKYVAAINRFNRLLDRMYCVECGFLLHPMHEANFAYYRVVRFHCVNTDCIKSDKNNEENEIYLHHCLNGKCNGIIDSRDSKKCPNGMYICSNEYCGCCCSNEMFKRVLNNLRSTGGYISQKLTLAVDKELGHLERGLHFCYDCGAQMALIAADTYKCITCNIVYELNNNILIAQGHTQSKNSDKRISINSQQTDHDDLPF